MTLDLDLNLINARFSLSRYVLGTNPFLAAVRDNNIDVEIIRLPLLDNYSSFIVIHSDKVYEAKNDLDKMIKQKFWSTLAESS